MKSKGFTLIELLVVISIVGLLSSIVLAALNTTRDKGKDSAVKAAMRQLHIQAQNYLDIPSANFGTNLTTCAGGVFGDGRFGSILTNIQANDAPTSAMACATDTAGGKWAVSVTALPGAGTSWCTDNSQSWFKAGVAQTAGGNQGMCQ